MAAHAFLLVEHEEVERNFGLPRLLKTGYMSCRRRSLVLRQWRVYPELSRRNRLEKAHAMHFVAAPGLVDVPVLDHVITRDAGRFSMAKAGRLSQS